MFGKKVNIKCPCGKVRGTITVRKDSYQQKGSMVCGKCNKRFSYEIIGTHSFSKYDSI